MSLKERIRALRLRLWAEHLGLLNETETFVDILDPVSQVAWSLFSTTAEHNRQCYDAVEHTLENTVAMTFDSYGKQEVRLFIWNFFFSKISFSKISFWN